MAINVSGILKSPQGSAIQNAEIIFEQTRTSTEVLAGTKFSIITNQTGNYSSSLGVGTYTFKVRFQDETQYRTVASNVIVTQSMDNYSLNQIIQVQSQLQDVDYDLLQDVIQARNQAAESAQVAQISQSTATTKASEASSSAQAALASKNAAQTSEANALASKNDAQSSQTSAAISQIAAANSQTAAANSQTTATTKATESSNSAQAALTSKNAAQTSETNALASKNAAQTSQTTAANSQTAAAGSQTTASTKASQAASSQTQAQQSQSDAGAAASQADNSAQQAQQSQTSASTSQATATTKASEASSSAQAALASKNAAQTSETNALASKNAAQTSQTNAAGSQTAASTSQTTASTKAGEASTSQTTAAASQTTATTKAGEASTSQTNAATSQATATTKAGEASTSQTNAAASQATATTKATEATNSATLAQKWAANPENSVVSGGLYSALHYAAKAAQSAQTATGQLVWRGGWSAQAGTAPPTPTGTTQDFYRITQAGTILSVQYEVGDYIHWDNINSIWFKMDGTDSVTSVNGRTGAVVVTKTDVGLSAVNNWGASSQTNDASTTTYATTAGVKAAYDLAATKLAATANAVSATKLVTARTINGTNFNGTANITTQNWGTSRNLTIGETAKAVNGSANISWTLDEIGALQAGATAVAATKLETARTIGGVAFDGTANINLPGVNIAGNQSTTGNAATATKLATARTISGVSFDGTSNITLTAADVGAVPQARTINSKPLTADITLSAADVGAVAKTGDTMTGNLTTPKVLVSGAQGTEANSVARRDFVESTVTASGKGVKDLTIALPAGAPSSGYIPVLFRTAGSPNSFVFIDTLPSEGSHPMNNCSFLGNVRASGWNDGGSYAVGQFTIYDASERAIHSIHGPSEYSSAYVVYVETRAFPIRVRVDIETAVTAHATDVSYGTSVFKVNGQVSGNTKTIVLANFDKGTGTYNGSNRVYDNGYNPTPGAVGAVNKSGDTMTGVLAVAANAQIGASANGAFGSSSITGLLNSFIEVATPNNAEHNSAGGIVFHNRGTSTSALYYKNDNSDVGYFNFKSDDSTYDVRVNGNKVYHQGFKPTAADVGALPIAGGSLGGSVFVHPSAPIATVTGLTAAPLMRQFENVGVTSSFIPFGHMSARAADGYVTHLNFGLYKRGIGTWDGSGMYVATGGSDGSPTEFFLLGYGGNITHSRGHTFYHTGNKPTAADVGAMADGGSYGTIYIRSDKRLKTNLVPLSDALEKVCKLAGYEYDKKKCLSATEYDVHEAGLIAQDVQAVLPAATSEVNSATASGNEENVLTISHGGVIALLVEAVKELSEKVKELEYGRT